MTKELSSVTLKSQDAPTSRKMINKTKTAIFTKTTYTKPTTLDFRLYPKESLIENSNSNLVMENNSNMKLQNPKRREGRWRFSSGIMSTPVSAILYLILYIFLTTSDLCLAARQDGK